MLELRLLNYFLVLSEELHYSNAAERLHISQPTLSNQIKLLEDIMGAKLFKYKSKKTALTEEGKILQSHAYKIFFDIEQTKNDIKNFSGKLRTQILISCVTLIKDSENVSLLPESFIKSLHDSSFKILPISDYPPRETINLIYRKDLFLDPILKDLLTIIREFHNTK